MRQGTGDLFERHRAGAALAVTTNGGVGPDGRARLGTGLAREVQRRFPWFAARLGGHLTANGNHAAHLGERLLAFPIEHGPFERPDLRLLARSARELAALAAQEGFAEVVLPRPGCGLGGLDWEREVLPIVAAALDDRFLVVVPAEGSGLTRRPS